MRRIASVLALTLSASTAAAQPWGPPDRYPGYPDRYPDPYRDPYGDRAYDYAGPPGVAPDGERWTELLVRPTGRPGVDTIVFQGRGGRLSWLMIPPTRGLRQIVIHYANRSPDVIRGGQLRRAGGVLQLDRRARIIRIDLISRRGGGQPYAVFGA